MRISHTHKIIFVSNPKTGSHSGFKLMEDYFSGNSCGGFHNVKVPEKYKNYPAFTFVRNPYDRAVSIWNSVLNHIGDKAAVPIRDRRNFLKAIGSDDFKSFCLWLQNWPNVNHNHPACQTQQEHLANCNVSLFYIHTEQMLEGLNHFLILNNISPVKEVPHELKRPHKTFWELGDQECLDAINIWGEKDFDFGYKKVKEFHKIGALAEMD